MRNCILFILLLGLVGIAFAADNPEETKNTHFFNTLSRFQLQRTMNFMRGSLGVHCDFCHVVDKKNGWQWEKDDKPTKRKARNMIEMVIAMNEKYFDGRPVVSCYTCHQGHTKPNGQLPLPQAAPKFPTVLEQPDLEGAPTADAILAKYFSAVGIHPGEHPFKSLIVSGTRIGDGDQPEPMEIAAVLPDQWYFKFSAQDGSLEEVVKTDSGWIKTPKETRDFKPSELENMHDNINTIDFFPVKEKYENVRLADKTKVGTADCYVLSAAVNDSIREKLYFDVATGLLLRRIIFTKSLVGNIPEQIDYADYSPLNGKQVPRTIATEFADPWVGSVRKFTEIKTDVAIPDDKFEKK